MNTQRAQELRVGVIVTAIVALGSLSFGGAANAEAAQASGQNDAQIVLPHQGPGVGSTKTPPFHDAAYEAYLAQQHTQASAGTYYHTTSGQPASWTTIQGPGPWSSKAPGIH